MLYVYIHANTGSMFGHFSAPTTDRQSDTRSSPREHAHPSYHLLYVHYLDKLTVSIIFSTLHYTYMLPILPLRLRDPPAVHPQCHLYESLYLYLNMKRTRSTSYPDRTHPTRSLLVRISATRCITEPCLVFGPLSIRLKPLSLVTALYVLLQASTYRPYSSEE